MTPMSYISDPIVEYGTGAFPRVEGVVSILISGTKLARGMGQLVNLTKFAVNRSSLPTSEHDVQ